MSLGKLTMLDMTPLGWLGRNTSTQTFKKESYQCLATECAQIVTLAQKVNDSPYILMEFMTFLC